jgi:hypothetical protein
MTYVCFINLNNWILFCAANFSFTCFQNPCVRISLFFIGLHGHYYLFFGSLHGPCFATGWAVFVFQLTGAYVIS